MGAFGRLMLAVIFALLAALLAEILTTLDPGAEHMATGVFVVCILAGVLFVAWGKRD